MLNNINPEKGMEFGLYTLGDHMTNPVTEKKISQEQRIKEIIELGVLADQAGIDAFGVGESHQTHFVSQGHTVILGALAQATKHIKLQSSATVLSVSDPVRVYEDFATIDLISGGRAEIVAGRGSRVGAYHLLGVDLQDYDDIFEEKLELLKLLNESQDPINWSGNYRKPLENAEILPQPTTGSIPLWRSVGGHPGSAIKAGYMGVPMMLTTLGGPAVNFTPAVSAYKEALSVSGYQVDDFPLGTTSLFYVGDTTQGALKDMYPYLNQGTKLLRGSDYPKQQFANAVDYRDALMVGDKNQIIEKLLYQYELFSMQRFSAQIDLGGMPFDKLMKNVEIIGQDILPAIKKHTKRK